MGKEEQFLWAVQTIMLANAVNLATNPERLERYRHVMSATGMIGLVRDALEAATRIPERMPPDQAADEFCGYMLENLREPGERVPAWFARG